MASSQVYYRKWRPRTLGEIAGQEPVTQTLLNALKSRRISHAYLFCGPRGTGKTTTARVLAKAVNCLENGKGEPCNACEMCQAVSEGRSLDVIEIDAASNTGVDDIRTLRERVNIAPVQARFKVYIVDEFHMLSTQASNALLKTLEEPPPHVIFILATTEVHKILPTIMSRCQRFDFRRLPHADVIATLTRICQTEKISVEPEGLRLIARSAAGSLRDALNLLEQMTTYFGTDVSTRQVQELLGITGDARVRELVKHLMDGNIRESVTTINSVNSDGLDMRNFKRELVDYLRGLLLVKTGSHEAVDLSSDDINDLKELAENTPLPKILKTLKLFSQAEIGAEGHAVLPLELAIIDAIQQPEEIVPAHHPEPIARQHAIENNPVPRSGNPAKPATHQPTTPSSKAEQKTTAPHPDSEPVKTVENKMDPPRRSTDADVPETPRPAGNPSAAASPHPHAAGSIAEKIRQEWRRILEQASPDLRRSPALAILRSGVQPVAFEKDTLVLSFRYVYLKDKMEEIENKRIIEKVFSGYLGQTCRVQCIVENNNLMKKALEMGAEIEDVEET